MHIHIDKHAHLHSPIHHWDPRFKIVSLFLLLLSCSFLQKIELASVALAISCTLLFLSKLPLGFILKKLKYPAVMLFFLALLLAVTSGGEVVASIGPLPLYKSGLYLSAVIFIKSISQLIIFFVLLETTPFTHTIKALYHLQVPNKLIAIAFFTFRYIFVYLEELRKMQTAARLRGSGRKFRLGPFSTNGAIIGSLMVRSFAQAERINAAMVLRGYTYKFMVHHRFKPVTGDYIKSGIAVITAGIIWGAHFSI